MGKYHNFAMNITNENMKANDALVAILKKSHAQAIAGQTVTMDEVNRFVQKKAYELTNPVDTCCVAEPC
jgi:hypothetical protein